MSFYYLNKSGIEHLLSKLKSVFDTKQDKITTNNKLAYSLISGTPTIPTVNNATLTIKKNGTNVTTFTANASSNATADITVPTKVSELTNDSGYKTTDNDTKNTAGATDTSSKIFLVGATSQDANPQTYSHDTAYVGTDGCLYSGGTKVLTSHQSLSGYATQSWVEGKNYLTGITKSQVTTALGYTPPTQDTNTTYTLTQDSTDGHKITLTPSSGSATTITIPDNNTWRGIQDNLTSDSSTDSLSAKQGKALKALVDGKQNSLTAQTAYSAKGSATKVPQITTNSLGQVTSITEVTITQPDISGKANTTEAGYSLSVSGTSVSLKNKSGTVLSTVTTQDTNTDTKVTQTVVGSDYTNWRPLIIGNSNNASEGFYPSTVTETTYTTQHITVQPSTGTIRAGKYKINSNVSIEYNATNECLDFIFS